MLKLILLIVGIWIIYQILKKYQRSLSQNRNKRTIADEDMVQCIHCNVHLPRKEGIYSRGEFFCTDEHRRLHQQDQP